jgi:hypothetical protein
MICMRPPGVDEPSRWALPVLVSARSEYPQGLWVFGSDAGRSGRPSHHSHPVDAKAVQHSRSRLPGAERCDRLGAVLSLIAGPSGIRLRHLLDVTEGTCIADLALSIDAGVAGRRIGKVRDIRLASDDPTDSRAARRTAVTSLVVGKTT